MKGKEFLSRKLGIKHAYTTTRYDWYEQNGAFRQPGLIPEKLRWIKPRLGWCTKAVDSLADRVCFDGFNNDDFYLTEIFQMNNADILPSSAIKSALITSCSFIYISEDENGYPRLQAIDGTKATGELDPISGLLTEGYAILKIDDMGKVETEAYFTPTETIITDKNTGRETRYPNPTGYALLVPVIHKPDARRPFGRSRISKSCIEITMEAERTLLRAECCSEFYSHPQRYALGMSEDAEFNGGFNSMSSMMRVDKDGDGDKPNVGQFPQVSMSPFNEQLRTLASAFAGETGLTLDDLGFSTATPATDEAIRAAHENLRLSAKAAQRSMGSGFINAGYLAACLRDKEKYQRSAFAEIKPRWLPTFGTDGTQLAGVGDAINKIQQSFPDYFDEQKLYDLTGI